MADSTHTQLGARRPRTLSALLAALVIVGLACASEAPTARADGDPASDVLLSQTLFLPGDAGLSVHQQGELGALVTAARRSGYQLRVALIASPADLGSVTALWRRPQSYASFLGQELSLVYRGTLLVVMPDGFGLYGPGAGVPAQRSALARLGTGGVAGATGSAGSGPAGAKIGSTAISAISSLAAASGHPLRVRATPIRTPAASTDLGALIALLLGATLMAFAWIASLRARPLRGRRPAQQR